MEICVALSNKIVWVMYVSRSICLFSIAWCDWVIVDFKPKGSLVLMFFGVLKKLGVIAKF